MKYRELKERVTQFCAEQSAEEHMVDLVSDLWRALDTSVRALRKLSVPANDIGSSCFRCGAKWGDGQRERHHPGCMLEGTEP